MAWEVAPWRPFRELERMRREMDRLWDTFFEERERRKAEAFGEWSPFLDVLETKNEIVVKAEIPGMNPKDIDISLSGGVLKISLPESEEAKNKEIEIKVE